MSGQSSDQGFADVCERLEGQARAEAEHAEKWVNVSRAAAVVLLTAAAALSAAGSASVFADSVTVGGILAGAGALAAAINAALRPAEHEAGHLKRWGELSAVADRIELLRRERAQRIDPDTRDAELDRLIQELADIRGRRRM
jgi:hypothetical protein